MLRMAWAAGVAALPTALPGRLPAASSAAYSSSAINWLAQFINYEQRGIPAAAGTDTDAGFDLVRAERRGPGCSLVRRWKAAAGAAMLSRIPRRTPAHLSPGPAGAHAPSAGRPGRSAARLAGCARGGHQGQGLHRCHAGSHPEDGRVQPRPVHKARPKLVWLPANPPL